MSIILSASSKQTYLTNKNLDTFQLFDDTEKRYNNVNEEVVTEKIILIKLLLCSNGTSDLLEIPHLHSIRLNKI